MLIQRLRPNVEQTRNPTVAVCLDILKVDFGHKKTVKLHLFLNLKTEMGCAFSSLSMTISYTYSPEKVTVLVDTGGFLS